MRSISIQRAGDLPPAAKAAVEQISITASPPEPSVQESREEVARNLAAFLDRRTKEVRDVPQEEIDAAIDEVCDYVRHHPARFSPTAPSAESQGTSTGSQ